MCVLELCNCNTTCTVLCLWSWEFHERHDCQVRLQKSLTSWEISWCSLSPSFGNTFATSSFLFGDSRNCFVSNFTREHFLRSSSIDLVFFALRDQYMSSALGHCFHTRFARAVCMYGRVGFLWGVPYICTGSVAFPIELHVRVICCVLRPVKKSIIVSDIFLRNSTNLANACDGMILHRMIGKAAGLIKWQSSVFLLSWGPHKPGLFEMFVVRHQRFVRVDFCEIW